MTDLNSNLLAIDLAKGDLEYAYNYLSLGQNEEQILDPYFQEVQKVKCPMTR